MNRNDTPEEAKQRAAMRRTPEGRLLVRYGFEPYDTESSARRVAERAAAEIGELVKALSTCRQGLHHSLRVIETERGQCNVRKRWDKAQQDPRVRQAQAVLDKHSP